MRMRNVGFGFVFFAATLAAAGAAWGDSLSIDSYTYPGAAINNITAAGNLDWALASRDEKSGGTAIQTSGYHLLASGANVDPSTGPVYPQFSYSGGSEIPGSSSGLFGRGNWISDSMSVNVLLPVGSGTITAWLWTWNAGGGTFSATLGAITRSHATTKYSDAGIQEVVLSYTNTTPQQTVTLTATEGGTGGAGEFYGVAVSTVPEPSTLALLASGLIGLLAYAWRKRR